MASLLEKIRVLVAADLNRLVDRALQSNDVAVFQHHVRELQNLQGQLDRQLVVLRGDITQLARRSDEQQALVIQQDHEVDQLVQAGLREDALAAQERLNGTRLTAAHLTAQAEKLEAEYSQLAEVRSQLDARVTALQQRAPEVDSLVGLAQAKELTGETMQSLDNLAGTGDPDVARIVNSIRGRLAEAEAQIAELERRGLAHGETPEALKRMELETQLEARKARLGV
jgi:phage shock protein A